MLVLASSSPRRRELLSAAGLEHVVRPSAISEIRRAGEPARDFVRRLAEEKARASTCGSDEIILAADTAVAIDDDVFGKPVDVADARYMLRRLADRDHWVHTGICLLNQTRCLIDVASTRVRLLPLEDTEVEEYAQSGEPQDKAGGYAIQGLASKFIAEIEGCYQNVVGLPISLVYRCLKTF